MTVNRRVLCGVYAVIALAALIATWTQNVAYLHTSSGFPGGFLHDLKANAATRSITVDVALLFLAAVIFMVVEARRHGIRFVWAYVAGGMLIAISVTFPLFLIARERTLADTEPSVRLKSADVLLLSAVVGLSIAMVVFTGLA